MRAAQVDGPLSSETEPHLGVGAEELVVLLQNGTARLVDGGSQASPAPHPDPPVHNRSGQLLLPAQEPVVAQRAVAIRAGLEPVDVHHEGPCGP